MTIRLINKFVLSKSIIIKKYGDTFVIFKVDIILLIN